MTITTTTILGLPVQLALSGGEQVPITSTADASTAVTRRVASSLLFDLPSNAQSANTVFAGPTSGAAAAPAFRALVSADIPQALVLATSLTTPIVYGGTTASSTLTLQSTSGVGTTDAILFKVGNNGAITAVRIIDSGIVGFQSASPDAPVTIGAINLSGISLRATGSTTNANLWKLDNTGGLLFAGVNNSGGSSITGGLAYSSFLITGNSTALQLGTNSTVAITVGASTGNVGFGANSPTTWPVTVTNAGPAWASYATIYDVLRVSVNGYPITAQFGGNAVGISEAIVGCIDVPATSAAANATNSIAGYGRSASTTQGAVGVAGFGHCAAAGVSAWGANFLVSNTPGQSFGANQGFTNTNLFGIEINTGVELTSLGATPNTNVRGIYFSNGGVIPLGVFRAIELDLPSVSSVAWKQGIYTANGACTVAIDIGTLTTGSTTVSQPLYFRGTNASSGTAGYLQLSANGDLNIYPWPASNVLLNPAGGFVGIDTAVPLANLHVTGLTVDVSYRITNAHAGGSSYDITVSGTGGVLAGGLTINKVGTGTRLSIDSSGLTSLTALAVAGAATLSSALTYGGVTLNNAVTGTGNMVLSTSPSFTTPILGTPTSGNLANCTGYPASAVASGAALTKTDDTNVTLTLGGTPASALLAASSLTLGWTGTLAAGRLNANVVQAITNDTNVTGTITAQVLTLGWTGNLAVSRGGTGLGTLTTSAIYKGAGTSAMAVSSITDDGTTFAIATNKFTVTESNGNTAVAGTFSLGGNVLAYVPPAAWTPVLAGAGGGPVTYSVQVGSYSRIGNVVFAWFYITTSGLGGSTGAMSITGLPLTSTATTNDRGYVGLTNFQGINAGAGQTQLSGFVGTSSTSVVLVTGSATGSGAAAIDASMLTSPVTLQGLVTYHV